MAYLEYFDPRRLALNKELSFHPDLMERIAKHNGRDVKFELILAELAAEFKIVLDGDYYPEELDNFCEILTKRLIERRTMVLFS